MFRPVAVFLSPSLLHATAVEHPSAYDDSIRSIFSTDGLGRSHRAVAIFCNLFTASKGPRLDVLQYLKFRLVGLFLFETIR